MKFSLSNLHHRDEIMKQDYDKITRDPYETGGKMQL